MLKGAVDVAAEADFACCGRIHLPALAATHAVKRKFKDANICVALLATLNAGEVVFRGRMGPESRMPRRKKAALLARLIGTELAFFAELFRG
jgi:hypothetical protein